MATPRSVALVLVAAALAPAACAPTQMGEEGDYEDPTDPGDPGATDVDGGVPDASADAAADAGGGELAGCARHRYLHVANYSFVAPLDCAAGVCKNACWGYQRRTSGFACDYAAGQADRIKTRDGGGAFASYNEIKPLNADDAQAVANCKKQSGHPLKTYVVWNGSGWNHEGISAKVHFAELYGPQNEALPHFSTWYNAYRGDYAPMINISPETRLSRKEVHDATLEACRATKRGGWVGVYFYDKDCTGTVCGMDAWKRLALIEAMNDCTASP